MTGSILRFKSASFLLLLFAVLTMNSGFFCGPPDEGIKGGPTGYGPGPEDSGIIDLRGLWRSNPHEMTSDNCDTTLNISDPFAGNPVELKLIQEEGTLNATITLLEGGAPSDEKVNMVGETDGKTLTLTGTNSFVESGAQRGKAISRKIVTTFELTGTPGASQIPAVWRVTVSVTTQVLTIQDSVSCEIKSTLTLINSERPE